MFLINPYILQASGSSLWDGIQAYYTADNTPNDALGTYNGTLTNGATYGTGIINNGFSFDGVNDYVQLSPNSLGFSSSQPHSYSCWVKTSVTSESWVLCNASGSRGTSLSTWANKFQFWFAGQNYYVQSTSNITLGSWNHLCVTYDGAGNISLYLNGTFDVLHITAVSWFSWEAGSSPRIGSKYNSTKFVNGLVDEVGIWDRELTASEVTELYNSGAAKQYPN